MTDRQANIQREIVRREALDASVRSMPDDLHPVLRRIYAARDVSPGQVMPVLSQLIPISELKGAFDAAERLADAFVRQERILVLGDFDADGATATALCVSSLRAMGFSDVVYLVPNRFEYGYGLSPAIAGQAAKLDPAIIMTVDNGISSIDGVKRAHEHGIQVIVTDHHLPGAEQPAAEWIVNPNLHDEAFPSKCLSGVGVAFYVIAALSRVLTDRGLIRPDSAQRIVVDTLDLVAIGTIADLVPLDYNNRVLVAEGLRRMRADRTRPGVRALFAAAGRSLLNARASDLGFGIAPRLNAAGRLADMSCGIDCLLTNDQREATRLAQELNTLNNERREVQEKMEGEAQLQLEAILKNMPKKPAVAYCLFDDDWHQGVVGLVASRIKDQARRPVIAFARSDETGFLKGSARSVDGVHIRDVIDAVATRHPELVQNFGGHAMAAGLTLKAADLDTFTEKFREEVSRYKGVLGRPDVIVTDGSLTADQIHLELAEALSDGGPWGQGFPEPVFDNKLEIVEQKLVKTRHLKLKLRYPGDGRITDAIAFNQPELPSPAQGSEVRFVYRLDVNEFRNRRTHQLVVEHMQCE